MIDLFKIAECTADTRDELLETLADIVREDYHQRLQYFWNVSSYDAKDYVAAALRETVLKNKVSMSDNYMFDSFVDVIHRYVILSYDAFYIIDEDDIDKEDIEEDHVVKLTESDYAHVQNLLIIKKL